MSSAYWVSAFVPYHHPCPGWQLGSSALVAWSLTRRTSEPFPEPPSRVTGVKVEGLRMETPDGHPIGAWLVRGERQKGCVLLLHGNGASQRQMQPVMQWLAEARFTVLAISFRAHGDSTGEINDLGCGHVVALNTRLAPEGIVAVDPATV